MKTQLLLIPMLLLCACRTTAGTKEKPAVTKPYAAEEEILLTKRIGALPKSEAQFYDCTVKSSDVKNLAEVKKWISEVPRDKESMIEAMHFRATEPSIEYYAYENILLYVDHSTLKYPGKGKGTKEDGMHPAVKALKDLADQHCPGPKK